MHSSRVMTKLADALKKKYRSPREALRALGLDENLISSEAHMSTNTDIAKKINALAGRHVSVQALTMYLKPRLAMDAKIPMAKVFDGITGKAFKDQKPVIAKRIRDLSKDKLAADASLEDVEKVLDMLDGHEIDGGDESVSEAQHNAMEAAAHGASNLGIPEKVGKEFVAKDSWATEWLVGKGMSPEVAAEFEKMMAEKAGATDETPEEKEKREREEAEKKAANDKAAKDEKDASAMKDMVSKPAMDEAIKTAVATARQEERDIRNALNEARDYVGELPATLAFDSSEKVYRHVLTMLGVDGAKDIHASALPTILRMQRQVGAVSRQPDAHVSLGAMDSAASEDFNKRFPGAARIGAA